MTTVTTGSGGISNSSRRSNWTMPDLLAPISMIPLWMLWSVIFLENWINLRLDAVYTEQFLSAPLLISGLKWLILFAVAFIISSITGGRYLRGSIMRDFLLCWFLSALTWSAWILFYTAPNKVALTQSASELDASPDSLKIYIDDFFGLFVGTDGSALVKICAYTATTALMLAMGTAMAMGIKKITSSYEVSISPNKVAQKGNKLSREMDRWFLIPAVVFVFCNGIFAWIIR